MGIMLKKGGRFNLSKKEPGLDKIMVGLGWEMKTYNHLDLDASVFMIGENGKIPQDEYFIFYNNLNSPDKAVKHTGDNRTGDGEGDDEMILANLSMVSEQVSELVFIASIHEAVTKRHHFGLLKDAYIRIVDVATNREIVRVDLDEELGEFTDMEFGRLYKENEEWFFLATVSGSTQGLQGYVDIYA